MFSVSDKSPGQRHIPNDVYLLWLSVERESPREASLAEERRPG
jgi:hypothetical protein